jgi:UDP-3-O-[3-hydroxymyristoyl] glucosamine N-acyltransferase
MKLSELANAIAAELAGDPDVEISSVATLEDAQPGQLSFLANPKYAGQMETTRASAVVVSPRVKSDRVALLKAKDPYYAFAQAIVALHGHRQHPHSGVHPKAHVEPSATVGEGTIIYPGAYVGAGTRVGNNCVIHPNVTIYEDCVLGDRVIIHAGTVIGQDGFGYAPHDGAHFKIPQVGNVVIEDDVEIGANCAIARASLGTTWIGKGTKIDGLVMIGHGTTIGEHGILVAQVAIAGSVTIGHHVTLAGQAGIAGHLKLGDNVTVGAQSGVMTDVEDKTIMIGSPAMPAGQARRVYSLFTQLPELAERVKQLEEKSEKNETADEHR